MEEIEIKQKEAKQITFTIKDSDGVVIDVSSATLLFEVKEKLTDTDAIISIADGEMNKAEAASGIVKITLTTTHTDRNGVFLGEMKTALGATNIDKSDFIKLIIGKAVTD